MGWTSSQHGRKKKVQPIGPSAVTPRFDIMYEAVSTRRGEATAVGRRWAYASTPLARGRGTFLLWGGSPVSPAQPVTATQDERQWNRRTAGEAQRPIGFVRLDVDIAT